MVAGVISMAAVQEAVPSNITFAEEVKIDRLKALIVVSVTISAVFLLVILTFGTFLDDGINTLWLISLGLLFAGAFSARYFLRQAQFQFAAWVYMLTTIFAVAALMYNASDGVLLVTPFIFPMIIFIGGLLLSPVSTFLLALLVMGVIIFFPAIGGDGLDIANTTVTQIFGMILTLFSAGLAAQVTGELYQITQWALDNYKKERSTNDELFEKRRELQLSLKRAEALSDKLIDTNQELEVAHQEAEEAKHFRGQFLANMSHELRTPLNAIIGFSETMLQFPIMYDNEELPPAYERDLNQIYNSGRQLLHVINDILDLAKVDAGKLEIHMQEVEVTAIVNAVMATAKGLLGSKPVKLIKNAPEELPTAWADETRLRQVLLNLYSNATKYTDEGTITLHITEQDDTLTFAVEDTGLGIDPEFHAKLFQEFQQAKAGGRDPRSGSGLGLAISRQLLELMGGDIWMKSTVGEGSTFYFQVAKYQGQVDESRPATISTSVGQAVAQEAK